jgi:hypothetical protein
LTRIVRTPDFTRMNFTAGGRVRTALLDERRVLSCMAGYHLIFVVAHADQADAALAHADAERRRHEGIRSIYTVLLTDEQLDALAADVDLNVAVLVAANNHAPARTAIKVHNGQHIELSTEHGRFVGEVTLSGELRTGDFYTAGNQRIGSDKPGLAVYRARADYDPATGEVQHHLVDPGYTPAADERTGALTNGADEIVFRLMDKAALLAQLDLTDLATANA